MLVRNKHMHCVCFKQTLDASRLFLFIFFFFHFLKSKHIRAIFTFKTEFLAPSAGIKSNYTVDAPVICALCHTTTFFSSIIFLPKRCLALPGTPFSDSSNCCWLVKCSQRYHIQNLYSAKHKKVFTMGSLRITCI